jgi:hypothetical protein
MDAVNWLLIHVADALLALGGAIKVVFGAIFHALDVAVEPILSPLLSVLNPICTAIGDVIYAAVDPLPVWLGLTILSVLAGILALIVFRYTSNQKAIGRALDDIKANLLALKLYKDQLRVTFQAQGRLLWAIVRLQRYMLTPFLVMLGPMLLGLAQMGLRHQWRPLEAGEQTLVTLEFRDETANHPDVQLEPSAGLLVEVGPVPGGDRLVWRVRGGAPGRHRLKLRVADDVIEKELVVGSNFQRVSAARVGHDWTAQLFHPAERALPRKSALKSIEVQYAGVDSWIYGANWWLLYFFVISMLTALVFKPLFKVRF